MSIALLVAALAGCAAPATRQAADLDEALGFADERPASVLIGGEGLDRLALHVERDAWPSSYRDQFEGETAAYHEYFHDVQGSPWGGFPNSGGFTSRQFRSDRVGGISR